MIIISNKLRKGKKAVLIEIGTYRGTVNDADFGAYFHGIMLFFHTSVH